MNALKNDFFKEIIILLPLKTERYYVAGGEMRF